MPTSPDSGALLDPEPITADRFAAVEAAATELLRTDVAVILPQAEATLPLEAAARGVGRPGVNALNVITSPYGAMFGRWLREAGATVVDVEIPFDRAVGIGDIETVLASHPEISVLSIVHAEAITGVECDLGPIAALVASLGVLLIVDAVASFGATPVDIDGWGVDICVIGPQKALAGPAGISVVTVSGRAWDWLVGNPSAPRGSSLSLLDWKTGWLDTGRVAVPGTPSTLEVLALEAALARVAEEGLDTTIGRHRAASAASRAGIRALGLSPWVAVDADAAAITTTVAVPAGTEPASLVAAIRRRGPAAVSVGIGPLAGAAVRIDHTGRRADLAVVVTALEAIGSVTGGDVAGATTEAQRAWDEASSG